MTSAQTDIAKQKQAAVQDPTNYESVRYYLDRASQPTFLQRITNSLVRPVSKRRVPSGVDVNANFGLAYTQQTNVAVAAALYATYRVGKDDTPTPLSHLSLGGLVSVNGFFRLQLSGENIFAGANDLLAYSVAGGVMPTYFWGLGYTAADVNSRSNYTRDDVVGSVLYKRRVVGGLWAGAVVDMRYANAHSLDDLAMLYLGSAGGNKRSAFSAGVGVVVEYDSRNIHHNPTRGLYVSLQGDVRPKALGDMSATLWHVKGNLNLYQALWRGAVMAVDMYADLYSSATPWLFWPVAGGENRLRGYYYGRYTDSKMASAQVELRQTIYGPFGICVWGGAATFFSSIKALDNIKLLPDYGIGLRLAAGGRTVLRLDCGFGRHSHGFIVNVNEAF